MRNYYRTYLIKIPNYLFSIPFRSGYLEKGSYLIVPSTTGCKLKKRRAQPSSNTQLVSFSIVICENHNFGLENLQFCNIIQIFEYVSKVEVQNTPEGMKKVNLSAKFRGILTDIYNQIDLDESGGLSRQEFNLFNWRTSGEEVQVHSFLWAEGSVERILFWWNDLLSHQ